MNILRPISQLRFETRIGFVRHPIGRLLMPELEWYADEKEIVLGLVSLDATDGDFYAAVFGRDTNGQFRWIAGRPSLQSPEAAREEADKLAAEQLATGKVIFPQGERTRKKLDLFGAHIERALNADFMRVRDWLGFSPAREIIAEIMHHYIDVDGNFVEQFQTTGFDSRLWELYIFCYLYEEGLFVRRDYAAPDFLVSNGEHYAAIEAVTVNPTQNAEQDRRFDEEMTPDRVAELQRDYMPIKFGSPLYSKLQKRYWELPHVRGRPLVFAIADFHEKGSMLWSSTALSNYLYGVRHDFNFDDAGKLVITPLKIETHEFKGKVVRSGFFFSPDAENVSAVMFSNSGTISKFNRMGKIAGFGAKEVRMVRVGTKHRHDPNAAVPDTFSFEISEATQETWGEGISIFHNPNAIHPLPEDMFPSVARHRFQNDQILSRLPNFYPYGSITNIFVPQER